MKGFRPRPRQAEETYDEILCALLRATPPARLRRALGPRPQVTGAPRSAAKQQLIARLAAEGWRVWLTQGRAEFTAARVISWRFAKPARARLGVTLPDRRGLPDEEGA